MNILYFCKVRNSMTKVLGDRQVKKMVRKTLMPNFTAELSLSATNLVDGIVAGNFYGSKALAAVGLGSPTIFVFSIIAGLIGTGNSVLCSRSFGQSSKDEASRIFSLSAVWAIVLSIISTAVIILADGFIANIFCGTNDHYIIPDVMDYIKGFSLGAAFIVLRQLLMPMVNIEGGNRHIHLSSFLILFSDAVFDIIFSAWLDWGTFGLGAASALSYVFGCLPLIWFFIGKRGGVSIKLRGCFSWATTCDIFKAGMPMATKRACSIVAPVLVNRYVLYMASVGTVAALSVQNSATRFLLCLALALSTTAMLIAGAFYGEDDRVQMVSGMKEMFRQTMIWSIGSALVFIVFAHPIAFVFIKDEPDVMSQSIYAIIWYAIGVPFMALNQCAAAFLQATKRINASQMILVAERFLVLVVFVYLLGYLMGENGVFMAYGLSEALLTLIIYAIVCFKKKKLITKFEDLVVLPADFGVAADHYIHDDIQSVEEAVAFSNTACQFCIDKGVDSNRANHVALCIRELSESSFTHALAVKGTSLTVRVFVEQDDGEYQSSGRVVIRLRDDGTPLNLDDRQQLNKGQAHAVAKEISYHASYGMNNTMVVL